MSFLKYEGNIEVTFLTEQFDQQCSAGSLLKCEGNIEVTFLTEQFGQKLSIVLTLGNNNNNNDFISIALFHVKHAQLH